MINYDLNNAAGIILECQKNIILNRQCIRELEKEGMDAGNLRDEIVELELKIKELKKVTELTC